jgi:homopolymeric O-antigen transport system permease protein
MMERALLKPRVHTPASPIRQPLRLLGQILGDMCSARTLAWRLFRRDIAAQYRQMAIGYLWAVVPSVLLTVIWATLNSSGIVQVKTGGTDVPYAVFVLTGMIFWQLFVDALNAPLKQLSVNRSMLNRVSFPTEALFISGVAQVMFSFLFKLIVLAAALAIFTVPIQSTAALVVFPAAGLVILGTAVGLLVAPLGLLFKDVEQGLPLAIAPLLFLTPVLYSTEVGGAIGKIMNINPLTPMFVGIRDLLYGGDASYWAGLAVVCAAGMFLVLVGWVIFRLALPVLVERLDA